MVLQGGVGSTTRSRFRTEALLRAAERGSVEHITRLWNEWPDDLPSAKRALSILLEHLRTNINAIPELEACTTQLELTEPTVALINACINSLNGLLRYFEKISKEEAEELMAILRPDLEYFFSWLAFFGRKAPALPGDHSGYGFGAARVAMLLDRGIHLADDPDTHERVADFCLALWMVEAAAPRPEGEVFTTEVYWECVYLKFDALWRCMCHGPTREQIIRRVNAFDRAAVDVLARSLYRELFDWPATHMQEYRKDPATFDTQNVMRYLQAAAIFCDFNPRFFRALLKIRFPTRACELAWDLRHARSMQPSGGTVAGEIANLVFGPMLLSKEGPRLVLELLAGKFMDVLAFELLSQPPEGNARKFDQWYRIQGGMNPLRTLLYFCYNPRISAALDAAIGRLPAETREALSSNPVASGYWNPFCSDFAHYQAALENFPRRMGRFCDSLKHYTRNPGEQTGIATQCSWCHTTVYCSKECQKEDWESFHKAECSRDRVQRIESQLFGSQISHRSRLFMLLHLQTLLRQCHFPQVVIQPATRLYFPLYGVDVTSHPIQTICLEGEEERYEIVAAMKSDPRAAAMARLSMGEPPKALVAAISGFWGRKVITWALFSMPELELLNGSVKVTILEQPPCEAPAVLFTDPPNRGRDVAGASSPSIV